MAKNGILKIGIQGLYQGHILKLSGNLGQDAAVATVGTREANVALEARSRGQEIEAVV
ncbi:unnamed protein product [Eruca vesicaria subsp. sativa]|uniref:Uncharacterized protein n=1 Tax=Eruca vesicaria subsp. sativa TaxID=29727 RepID=A0ABC8L127_ERUVS|nr:unnamed protein product [Eruca vesicaria subsp. sativa]